MSGQTKLLPEPGLAYYLNNVYQHTFRHMDSSVHTEVNDFSVQYICLTCKFSFYVVNCIRGVVLCVRCD